MQIAMHEGWQMCAHNVILLYLLLREKSRHEFVFFGSVFLLYWWVIHLLRGSQLTAPLWQLMASSPWAKTTLAAAGRAVQGSCEWASSPVCFVWGGGVVLRKAFYLFIYFLILIDIGMWKPAPLMLLCRLWLFLGAVQDCRAQWINSCVCV